MLISRVLRGLLTAFRPRSAAAQVTLPPRSEPRPDRLHNFFMPVFWGTSDVTGVTDAAKKITRLVSAGHYFGDNLLTWGRNMSMLDDEAFVRAWRSNIESPSDEAIVWRRYVLAMVAYHCVQLDGDFVECGAYTGVGIKTVIDYLGGIDFPKTFWGYDTFEHTAAMLNHPMPALSPELFDRIRTKFASYPQVRPIKGSIPESFVQGCPSQVAYLHIDMNQAPAEVAALDRLFDLVVPGGIVILDDYEWAAYRPQKLAEDPWFDKRGYRVMPLPTGQGLVFKR